MSLPPVVHPLSAGLAGVTSAWLTVLTRRFRDDRETRAFVGLTGGATLWALSYAVALLVHDPTLRWGLELLVWTGRLTVPVAWLVFALEYTGRSEPLTRSRVAVICVLPVVTLLTLVSNPVFGLLFENYRIVGGAVATVQYTPTTYFWVQLLYSYALIGTGTLVLFGMVLSPERLFSVQAGALVVGALVPTVTNVLWLFDWGPVPGLDLTPAALSITCGSFAVALLRFDLLGLSPKPQRLGWRAAVADFDDGVLVVGTDGRVVDANPAAESLFPDRDPFGEAVTDLLDEQDLPDDGTITLGLDTAVGRRRYEITVSPVADRQERQIGQTFVLRDITEREQREQRLSVLNRVLRHNLRNDMNVIRGSATAAEGATEQDEAYIDTVADHADELVELSETARTIQRVVDADPSLTRAIDVRSFVEEIVREVVGEAAETVDGDAVDG
ncbi:MAG: histidine kinase N-terminal 7TM domain-containing protein, partial [Halobaculum sp.]